MLGGYNVEIKKAYVNDLIVLCNMIDSFSGFSSDFYELMKMNCEIDVVIKLCNVGVTVKANKKFFDFKNMRIIKDFYQKQRNWLSVKKRTDDFPQEKDWFCFSKLQLNAGIECV